MESFEEIWQLVKQELKKQVTEVAYNVWLSPLEFVKFENNTVFLSIRRKNRRALQHACFACFILINSEAEA